MKYFLVLFTFLTIIVNAQNLNIKSDTVKTSINGEIRNLVKLNDDYFAIVSNYYSKTTTSYTLKDIISFYKINKKGIATKINLPTDIKEDSYRSLFTRNDSLFVTGYHHKESYHLKNNEWISVKNKDEIVYEDKDYIAFAKDFGEWGGTTWFENKKTKKQTFAYINPPKITKVKNIYYLTNYDAIYQLKSPENLSKALIRYENFKKGDRSILYNNYEEIKMLNRIFYSEQSMFNPKFGIVNSYLYNDKLYFLFFYNKKYYLGQLNNGKLTNDYNIDFATNFLNYNMTYLSDTNTVQFEKNENIHGILGFKENTFYTHYLINEFQEKIYSKNHAEKLFIKDFEYYFENLGKLNISEIEKSELILNALEITENRKVESPLSEYTKYDSHMVFRKKEEDYIDIITQYIYSSNDEKIGAIGFIWNDAPISQQTTEKNPKKDIVIKALKDKSEFLSNFLTGRFGKPTEVKENPYEKFFLWKIENKVVRLSVNKDDIILKLYQN